MTLRQKIISLVLILLILCLVINSIIFLPSFLFHQNNDLEIDYYNATSNKLPLAFKGYKIIFLSDLHINDGPIYKNVISQCRNLNPDIIIISGDIVESSTSDQNYFVSDVASFAKDIGKIAPVYWITGNYEASLSPSNFQELKTTLKSCGFTYLDNLTKPISKNGQTINICGINDPLFGIYSQEFKTDIEKTIVKGFLDKALPKNLSSTYTILAAHRTEYCEFFADSGVDMLLTGHAHGGQIRIPIIGALFAPGQGLFPKYTTGEFKIKSTQLIINRGIGASRIKQRLFNPPEIILITL